MNKLLFIANLLALSFMSFGLMSCSDKDDTLWGWPGPERIPLDKDDLVFEPTASSDSVEFLVEENGFRPIGYVTDVAIQIGDGDIPEIFNPTVTVGGYKIPANPFVGEWFSITTRDPYLIISLSENNGPERMMEIGLISPWSNYANRLHLIQKGKQ
jgi:hypothetical protein